MNKVYLFRFLIAISVSILLSSTQTTGQNTDQENTGQEEVDNYEKQALQLVSFLQYTFNTLGDPDISAREKDILINSSYLKFFRDDKVQIEDDLDENRDVVTNKDVQAYLKDIHFFFKTVEFKFDVEEISREVAENGQIFFKVSLNRNLRGITIDNDSVNNNHPRYIEINLNEESQDLKIVSIYTSKLSEDEDLANWWLGLPIEWKVYFDETYLKNDTLNYIGIAGFTDSAVLYNPIDTLVFQAIDSIDNTGDSLHIALTDSIPLETDSAYIPEYDTIICNPKNFYRKFKSLWNLIDIDISGNYNITSLEPLKKLTGIEDLNISNTGIDDLTPIRNLSKILRFNAGNTFISSIEPLHYCIELKELTIDNTIIKDISGLKDFKMLEILSMNNTMSDSYEPIGKLSNLNDLRLHNTSIDYLAPLGELKNLQILDLSNTAIKSIEPLRNLTGIQYLNIDHTDISDIAPLSELTELRFLYMDYTLVTDLAPLMNLPSLELIYCDNSGIDNSIAQPFMNAHPGILVVYESGELNVWWNELTNDWKNLFASLVTIDSIPSKEQLHSITQINEIIVPDTMNINDINPLRKLINLNKLDISNIAVSSLEPIQGCLHLTRFSAENTQITDLGPLANLNTIQRIDIAKTAVSNIQPLATIDSLEYLNIEETEVSDILPLADLPNLEIIYGDKSKIKEANALAFHDNNTLARVIYKTERLQTWWNNLDESWQQVLLNEVSLQKAASRRDLHDLANISELSIIENKNISTLTPVKELLRLEKLTFTSTLIPDLSPVKELKRIYSIDCSNNPLSSIEPLSHLKDLVHLNIENTLIENFETLGSLLKIESLNISGTAIKDLKLIGTMGNLKVLDFYNTRINSLKPLDGHRRLEQIKCYNTKLNDKKVAKFKEENRRIEVIFY